MNEKNSEHELNRLRNQIDTIDSQLLSLINQRLEIGQKVGTIKKQTGSQILDRTRERKLIERLFKLNRGPAGKDLLRYVFNVIITATREIQKPKTISFLGPEASYTHVAALTHFKHSGKFVEQPNLYEIFREVEKNQSHFGVVPVENSIEGAVNHTLDLFADFDLNICAEHYEPVSHDLLSITGEAEDVQKIYSHPQALAQCKTWIKKKFAHAEIFETTSTSKAALLASDDKTIAAIAGKQAAHLYELQSIESKIEDYSGNITRFLVIGKEMPEPTGQDKTSIMFATSHVPGALFKALEPVNRAQLNMLKLESRPTRHHNWSYYFFLDIEGHKLDKRVADTIEEIKQYSLSLKILGSYPVFAKEAHEA
ncbi:prephenate dehydratase [Desulfobacula toluolica]|uniref:Bifunctional chorismate mutase/prephenate dehydratase n=1 Tax=Desulfobacula toluolica (strain DSM 7467 / Tol2) TaxID=651182 RepID=K0NG66_DESTT|nr:prephenate dehydratase [Desulfobacula toluolica]CCK80156.1 PheA: P-protein (includes: chorismate mutase and prephenate dehydratase) [Desulfobacula toluolica Tol2]